MNSDYRIYLQEIVDFLGNITIKFSPFETLFNSKLEYMYIPGFDISDKTTYPYYRILAGDSAFATVPIYCYSPMLNSEVLLTRANVINDPEINIFYHNVTNLKALLARYPNDQFVIQRILNPVKDIQAAINAPNLTILETQYGDQFLNQYERSSLLLFLQDILWRIDYRWYMSPYEFEDLYPYTFWAMLWSVLPLILLTKRTLNIKTYDVHPFHIWEYLTSLGFGGYRGYLTHNQELFLYRNALYLKYNAGKSFLLKILEKVFLTPLRYSLSKKTIVCTTLNREATHDKYPDVIPASGTIEEYASSTTFTNLLQNIHDDGHDVRADPAYFDSIASRFSKAPVNKLVTKFLEFERNIDMSEMMLLLKFILDSTVYLVSKNQLKFGVSIQSSVYRNTLYFNSVIDALNLLFYCIYMKQEPKPTVPFTNYTLTTAIPYSTPPVMPKEVFVDGWKYRIKSYVDVDTIVNSIPYIKDDLYSVEELSSSIGAIYDKIFDMINHLGSLSDCVEHETHVAIYRKLIPEIKVITVAQPYASYDDFFKVYPEALNEISNLTDDHQLNEFMYSIITSICPLEIGFSLLARDDQIISVLIQKIKELFTYMVSYNITFLNKVFDQTESLTLPKITAHIDGGSGGDATTFINSAFSLSDEATSDYRLSMTEIGFTDISLTLDLNASVDMVRDNIPIMIEAVIGDDSSISDINSINPLYITNGGVYAKLTKEI